LCKQLTKFQANTGSLLQPEVMNRQKLVNPMCVEVSSKYGHILVLPVKGQPTKKTNAMSKL